MLAPKCPTGRSRVDSGLGERFMITNGFREEQKTFGGNWFGPSALWYKFDTRMGQRVTCSA